MSHDMGQFLGTEVNLMEMSEGEYTHLQHLLHTTQMDDQAADHDGVDGRFPATLFGLSVTAATTNYDPGSVEMFPSPTMQAVDLSTSNYEQCVIADARLNEAAVEEQAMVISRGGPSGEKTPTTCGEVPGSVLVKLEAGETLTQAPAPHGRGSSLNRAHCSARVSLEKMFSCMAEDRPQDTRPPVLTNLTMLQQSTECQEASFHPQMQKWMQSDQTNPIEPYRGALLNPITGVCGQAFGHISHIVEPNKHQGLINAKEEYVICTSQREEQEWVEVEKDAVPPAPVKLTCSKILRGPNVGPQLEGPRAALEAGRSGRKKTGSPAGSSQRREKHNSKERDRRRRIRMCCNELNTLVPFCQPDTDKATTLKWTATYLKYIKEVYGDSPRENFRRAFWGKTGLHKKPSTDSDHQEMAGTASTALAIEQ